MSKMNRDLDKMARKLERLVESGVPMAEAIDAIAAGMGSDLDLRGRLERIATEIRGKRDPLSAAQRHLGSDGDADEGLLGVLARLASTFGHKGPKNTFTINVQMGNKPAEAATPPPQERPPKSNADWDLLVKAVKSDASDVHLEPAAGGGRARFRLDGVLDTYRTYDEASYRALLKALKVRLGMDPADERPVEDQACMLEVEGKQVQLRAARCPYVRGEGMTLRICGVDPGALPELDGLGFSAEQLDTVRGWLDRPFGLVVVTGPIGCGKTSTLYGMLRHYDADALKVVTVEQPAELLLEGVNQVSLTPSLGLTWENALKVQLRQDPDVVMVGEVASAQVADLVLKIALTGHVVLTAFHAETFPALLERMRAIGIEPHLLAAARACAVAQRLVRRLCASCRVRVETPRYPGRLSEDAPLPAGEYYAPVGCEACRQTGYRGRLPLFELGEVTAELAELLAQGSSPAALSQVLRSQGYRTLLQDGLARAAAGLTSLEEVARVCL